MTESTTWKSGGVTVASWSYSYDGAGRLTSVTNSFGETTSYAYDSEGKLLTQSNQNGTMLTYGYNQARGWPTSVLYALSGTPFASYSLNYDQGANTVGNLTNVSELDGSAQVFTYDDLDRLTAEARTGTVPFTRSYAYDLANNVTQADSTAFATYDAGNKILGLTGGTISFYGNGRLTSLSHPTIGNGSFIWNSSDKMTSQTVSGVTSTYKYDHRGLRLASYQGSESQWVYYIFSGDSLIGEVRASGEQKAFTWGADGIVSIRNVTAGNSRWLHYGPQGEARYLTDASGAITDSYNYSAYGVVTSSTGSSYNPFRYGGKVGYYSYGGLILAGQRWYHPGLMRWLSRDPILYDGGDNVYAYVEGNPVGWVDPDGLAPVKNMTDRPIIIGGNKGAIKGKGPQIPDIRLNPGERCSLLSPKRGVRDVDAIDGNDDGVADVGDMAEKVPGTSFTNGWVPGYVEVVCKKGSYGPGCEITW
ncbi:MAG: hypothetical protein PHC51_08225 [bacterium]|nr:hypothetical protein [bacterium]